MEVICRNAGNYLFTEGKSYKVISINTVEEIGRYGNVLGYTIKNYFETLYVYPMQFFESLKDQRQKKLKKICETNKKNKIKNDI